ARAAVSSSSLASSSHATVCLRRVPNTTVPIRCRVAGISGARSSSAWSTTGSSMRGAKVMVMCGVWCCVGRPRCSSPAKISRTCASCSSARCSRMFSGDATTFTSALPSRACGAVTEHHFCLHPTEAAPVRSRLGHRTGPARRDGHRRLAPTWHRLLTPAQPWPLLLWPGRVHHLIADPGAHRVGFPVLAADGYLVAIHEPDVPERFGVRVLLPVADRGFTGDLRARRVPQRFEHGLVQFGLALQWCGFGREQHAHAGVLLRPIGLPLRSGFGEVPAL